MAATSFASCARPQLAERMAHASRENLGWIAPGQVPVVYDDSYNIGFLGIEKLHPMDSAKYGKVVRSLVDGGVLKRQQLVQPKAVTDEVLRDVHSERHVKAMRTSKVRVALVMELPLVALLPNFLVQRHLVTPMTCHVGGTMLAACLAVAHGWAINLGGGMHHGHHDGASGWCPFDDIMLAVRHVRRATGGQVQRVMVVDLDAHQGNGVERDKLHFGDMEDLYIVDAYNARNWPEDHDAKAAINVNIALEPRTSDAVYLERLGQGLQQAFSEFQPDLLVYNAGTDILKGDPLGYLSVSAEGIRQRDEMVWQAAADHGVPLVMLLSGGYARGNAAVIAASLLQLFGKFGLAARTEPSTGAGGCEAEGEPGAAASVAGAAAPAAGAHDPASGGAAGG